MNANLLYCAECGALQANQPACGVCGARLGGFDDGGQGPLIDRSTTWSIALFVLALLGGIVAATALVLWLVFALF